MTSSVNGARDRLSDGALLGTGTERTVRTPGKSRSDVRRDGRRVTVTAPFMGQVGGGDERGFLLLAAVYEGLSG